MLNQDDRQRLRAIETGLRLDDPRFAEAMRDGKPCPPREYRRQLRLQMLLLAILVVVAVALGALAGSLV